MVGILDMSPVGLMAKNAVDAAKTAEGKAQFGETDTSSTSIITQMVQFIVLGIALYMAFKCKRFDGSVSLADMLLACCSSPCYIIYRLLQPCQKF